MEGQQGALTSWPFLWTFDVFILVGVRKMERQQTSFAGKFSYRKKIDINDGHNSHGPFDGQLSCIYILFFTGHVSLDMLTMEFTKPKTIVSRYVNQNR